MGNAIVTKEASDTRVREQTKELGEVKKSHEKVLES